MTALAILLKFWPYIAGVAGVLFALWKARQSGIKSERAKQAQSEAKARSVADDIDDAVVSRSPDANRKELGSWSAR